MTSFKDKLKESQGSGEGYSTPELLKRISMTITMRTDDKVTPKFCYYDKENKVNKFFTSPIEGVLLGVANKFESFDRFLGSKGGTYKSTYYFRKSNEVAVFGGDEIIRGTVEQAEAILKQKSQGTVKKRSALFVLTTKGKLVVVETNMSLFISNMNVLEDGATIDKFVKLTPTLYNNKLEVAKGAKEYLGAMADQNPPKFALIETTDEITEEFATNHGLIEYIDLMNDFKAQTDGGDAQQAEVANQAGTASYEDFQHDAPPPSMENAPPSEEDPDNDLPW